jgi:diguanylate cyclase (GGDEF)-like protein
MQLSSSRKRLILVGLVIIAAIAAAVGVTIDMERRSEIAAFGTAVNKLANGMAQQTARSIGSVDRVLQDLPAALLPQAGAAPEQAKAALRSRAAFELLDDRQKRLPGVDALVVLDADGKTANTSDAWPVPPADLSGQDFFRHFSDGRAHDAFVGSPGKGGRNGGWTSVLARRISDAKGGFAGVALAKMSLAELEDFYHTAMPPGRSVSVMRPDGTVLVHFPPDEARIGRTVPDAAWYALVARGGGIYRSPGQFDRIAVVGAVRPLRDLPLVIEADVPESEVLAGWRAQRLWVVVAGVAAAVGVILLLRLLGAQFQRIEQSELSLAAKNNQLETAHQQFDAALSNMSQGVVFFNRHSSLVVCNRRYGEVYKLPPDAIRPGTTLAEIVDHCLAVGSNVTNMTRADYLTFRRAAVQPGQPHHSIAELQDGRTIAVQTQPMPDGGWVTTHEDITERRKAEAQIAYVAQHDVLTGLANRALFQERIGQALAGAQRGTGFAVLFLDLDRFKSVNDTLGHKVGDDLLRGVATRLRATVREIDTVARLGGDEFVILQIGINAPDDAAQLAERILTAFREPYVSGEHRLVAGTSIGVAFAPNDGDSADLLLKNADLALYIAKGEGRGTFRFFEPEMDANVQNRHGLELDLREAVARGELELHYQPIINVQSGRVCAFEALLRWNHPVRGQIAPADFIPIAEESRLIVPIGEWVVREACRQAAEWPDAIHVAVNLSPVQFRAATLVQVISGALARSGLAAGRLELEITETVLLKHSEANLAILHQLRDLGICIAMDDFGVGYSSLSYLRHFPFDKIKIDRLFIKDITEREDVLFIVRAIVGLCRDLRIRTTVEGVETAEQLAVLLAEGCTEVQGFLFGRPQPADRLAAVIAGAPKLSSRTSERVRDRAADHARVIAM